MSKRLSSISGITGSGSSFAGSKVIKSDEDELTGGWVSGTESDDDVLMGGWVSVTESDDDVLMGGWVSVTESDEEVLVGGWITGLSSIDFSSSVWITGGDCSPDEELVTTNGLSEFSLLSCSEELLTLV